MPIAAKNVPPSDAILARFPIAFGNTQSAPESLMVMPAGTHAICAFKGDSPVDLTVKINAQTAEVLEAARAEHMHRSPHRPYFDFNHESGPASGWPTKFFWSETPQPGVYAAVDWSKDGAEAVSGRTYRAFSPSFFLKGDRVTGAPLNMGGLVNDPAFKQISPLWAKDAGATASDPTPTKTKSPMNEQEIAALQAKLKELQDENTALKAKAASEDQAAAISAKQAEIDALNAKLSQAETVLAQQRKDKAQAAVQAAVTRGALPPKDTAIQAKWAKWCEASPEMIEALNAIPGSPILAGRVTPQAGDRSVVIVDEDPVVIAKSYGSLGDRNVKCKSVRDKAEVAKEMAIIYAKAIRGNKRFENYPILAAEADDTLGTLTGALVSQKVLDLFKLQLPLLRNIATDFSSENAAFNQQIVTRIVSVPSVQTYSATVTNGRPAGWSTAVNPTTTDVPVTISNHKGVPIELDANALAETARRLFDEVAPAASYALAKDIHDALLALITAAEYADPAPFAAPIGDFGRPTFAKAARILNLKGAPMMDRYALVNSTFFEKLTQDPTIVSLAVFQKPSVITDSELPMISRFQPLECPSLPETGNMAAFFGHKSALVLATRVPNDYTTALPGASNGRVSVITNPDDGMSVMLTEYVNHERGAAERRISIMYGVDQGQKTGGQIVTSQ